MITEAEFHFMRRTFEKCGVPVRIESPDISYSDVSDAGIRTILSDGGDRGSTFSDICGRFGDKTVYRVKVPSGLIFLVLLFPYPDFLKKRIEKEDLSKESVLILGPYLSEAVEDADVLLISERYRVPPQKQKLLAKCYETLAVIPESSHLFAVLDSFCEILWETENYSYIDITREKEEGGAVFTKNRPGEDVEGILLNMDLMEKRYALENEMMRAVSHGHSHKVPKLLDVFSELHFEKRLRDPLRNLKNYCIIMNTLFRKAAEDGGVHPIYLDEISSGYAVRIEQLTKVSEVSEFMRDMFLSYCRLVRKHTMKDYSPIVQKVITIIDSDLSANLTLSGLAASQKVSGGYLSSIFKRETGKTLTEYINGERMQLAMHLLGTTHLQIQTVALHSGMLDVQYFSKVFKKYTGKTPKEYREMLK